MVAWVPLHGVEQREDLALVEDPFGEPVIGPRRPDGGADVRPRRGCDWAFVDARQCVVMSAPVSGSSIKDGRG